MAILMAETEAGMVRGTYSGNDEVSVFKGIPFAAPPVDERRWKAPEPPEHWDGIRDCYIFSDVCIQDQMPKGSFYQKEFYGVEYPMSEDCLYMNIWTPTESPEERLPVCFYIHGGGFNAGMACNKGYDGEAFGKKGVITVTFNYRVGIWGFFAHPELTQEDPHQTSGNYGILDQIAALKWVRRNISVFGGDPDQITVMGQSAGGGSVQLLCESKLTEQCICRAIIQSAIGSMPVRGDDYMFLTEAEQRGTEILQELGAVSVSEARRMNAMDIQKRFREYGKKHPGFRLKPVKDGYVIPEEPMEAACRGHMRDIPYLIGCTADEMGNGFIPPEARGAHRISSEFSVRENLIRYMGPASERYYEVPEAARRDMDRVPKRYVLACTAWSDLASRQGRGPVYQYVFCHRAPGDDSGAFHSVEHPYVFQTLFRIWRPYGGDDMELSNLCCSYWTNFIRTGDPNGEGLPEWSPYTEQCPEVMQLDIPASMTCIAETPYVKLRDLSQGGENE